MALKSPVEAPEDEAPSHTPRQLTDPVSNELDVMRGRRSLHKSIVF